MNIEDNIISSTNQWWLIKCKSISYYVLSYCFYIHIILLLLIAIIQLRFSTTYEDACTIDDRIILYLLVFGIIQIIYTSNGIILIILSIFYEKYLCFTYFLCINFIIHQCILLFLFIWFIIGNYLVFHVKTKVQYTNSYNVHTYCNYTLYQTAFWINITYYILIILFSIIFIFINKTWFIKHLKNTKNKINLLR